MLPIEKAHTNHRGARSQPERKRGRQIGRLRESTSGLEYSQTGRYRARRRKRITHYARSAHTNHRGAQGQPERKSGCRTSRGDVTLTRTGRE